MNLTSKETSFVIWSDNIIVNMGAFYRFRIWDFGH